MTFEVGSLVAGRFKVTRVAATGGMGAVYEARDGESGDVVALKVLQSGHHDARFALEAELLAEMSHPGIVRYVAHGRTPDGAPFLAMEWLEGEELASRIQRGPLDVADAVDVARQLTAALGFLHRRGIVHRDLKPSNVFLVGGQLDSVRLIDLGIARRIGRPIGLTRTGTIVGTPAYMAPEQVRGDKDVDARADVFALGCILYECVAGEPAFVAGSPLALFAKILLTDPPRPSDGLEVPPWFDGLVEKLLVKDRAGRPADADAVGALLHELPREPFVRVRAPEPEAALSRREQRLVTVMLASRPSPAPALAETVEAVGPTISATLPSSLLESLRLSADEHGGRLEPLVDGSLLAVFEGRSAGADVVVRAIRYALAARPDLEMHRITVATGRAIITDNGVFGIVVERAVALAERAHPGGPVLVDDASARLVAERFVMRPAGDTAEVLGVLDGSTRLLGQPTPFVGRDRELATLTALWDAVCDERSPAAVAVIGPAGAGKTRLMRELTNRLEGTAVAIWKARADSMRSAASFGLLTAIVRSQAGLLDGESRPEQMRKIRARVADVVEADAVDRVAAFLTEIMGEVTDDVPSVVLAARREAAMMRHEVRRAWCDWIVAETRARPVVLFVEDAHWADGPTLGLLGDALGLDDCPLLVVATARPEIDDAFPRLWADRGRQDIHLRELPRRAAERLVRHALGDACKTAEVERIVLHAAGNAFYLEELIRAQARGDAGGVPDTILAVVGARLELAPPDARRVLRGASIVGETFWRTAVARVLGEDDAVVEELLGELTRLELVSPRATSRFLDEKEYAFRHALVRDAAYATLVDGDRIRGHALAGAWLEAVGEPEATVIADHFVRGRADGAAARWLVRAAQQALARSDFGRAQKLAAEVHAIPHCPAEHELEARTTAAKAFAAQARWREAVAETKKALEVLPPNAPAASERRAELLSHGAMSAFWGLDLSVLDAFAAEAVALGEATGRKDVVVDATTTLGSGATARGQLAESLRLFERARTVAGNGFGALVSNEPLALYWLGEFERAVAIATPLIAAAREGGALTALMMALPAKALSVAALGRYGEADDLFDEACELGRRYEIKPLLARVLTMAGGVAASLFDDETAMRRHEEARALASSLGYAPALVSALLDLGFGCARMGAVADARAQLAHVEAALESAAGWHEWIWRMRHATLEGEVALAAGAHRDAIASAGRAIAASATYGRGKYGVLARIVRGRARLGLGELGPASTDLHEAYGAACQSGDPALRLRAGIALLAVSHEDVDRRAIDELASTIAAAIRDGDRRDRFLARVASSIG